MSNAILAAFEKDLRAYAERNEGEKLVYVGKPVFDKSVSVSDRTMVGQAYSAVVNFLNNNNMYGSEMWTTAFCPTTDAALENMNVTNFSDATLSNDIVTQLGELCVKAKVPNSRRIETMRALHKTLHDYLSRKVGVEHWISEKDTKFVGMETMYPSGALNNVTFGEYMPGKEAFGSSMDTVLPDVRLAMTINLLKPHKGVMSRLLHRHTLVGSVIQYVIHADEFYDLTKSQNPSGDVRNSYEHRLPIVSLYRNPEPVNMLLQPIVPQKSKDTKGQLIEDGVMVFGKTINMMDLTLDPGKVGYNALNYTDLVSEGVLLQKIVFEITKPAAGPDPAVVERYVAEVDAQKKARLVMPTQVDDSGERATNLTIRARMNKASKLFNDHATEIFEALSESGTELVDAVITVAPQINLKTGIAHALGQIYLEAATTVMGGTPLQATKDLAAGLTATLVGYSLDAKFSDENMRKVNMAVRTQTYTAHYEMPQGKAIVVDFSMQQTVAEHILNTGQEVQALGIDHRNIQAFLKLMRMVHDQGKLEAADPNYRERNGGATLNTAFVSGQRVNPTVIMGSIDLRKIVNWRSSDMFGDIRQYMDSYLLKAISILHVKSLYVQQLNNGEVPTYKVLTSGPIIENLFSIPHIHNHMMPNGMDKEKIYAEKTPGEPVEFVRILASGVRLECITTTFSYMADKIMIIPFHAADPSSELSFAHNWDSGQFVANYTPVDGNQVNKRMYMNSREWAVPLCPCGLLLNVIGLEEVLPDITGAYEQPAPVTP